MKNRKTIILYFVLLVFIGFYSCDEVYYDGYSYSIDNPPAFLKIYGSETDFTESDDDYDWYYEYTEWESEAEDHKAYTSGTVTRWVDGRTPEGYSTWSHPQHTFTFSVDATQAAYDALGYYDKDDHKHIYKGTINMSSPPAHLHLCLNSWNQDYYYYYGNSTFKTWQIESITNESGQSLAEDPDWTNYTDNFMTFYKASKFVYTPGQKRSETEIDFFEAYPKNPEITGTYTVVEDASKKVTLTVNFPNFSESFEVVESSWDGLTLKGTVKGKTGFMHLMPQ